MQADNGRAPEDRTGRQPTYEQLLEECVRLRKELAKAEWERDGYLKALYKYLPHEAIDVTDEELLACVGQQRPLIEVIHELTKDSEHGK